MDAGEWEKSFWVSLPSRERGLKSVQVFYCHALCGVAPLAGAWIEIALMELSCQGREVAPLAGAWIEISRMQRLASAENVAPLAGAWIEIVP